MTVDVTVVVPVWNPGPYIEPLIESLLAQTHPAERLEFLFVDDGATDDTPARLDRLAAEYPQVRVIHQENSGWPGKPRNVGTDEARGEYVFFVDQDDHLRPRTIERMLEVGQPNGADVILGKVTSDFRGVPHGVFRENRERCTVRDAPLIDSLTPHKMFRRDFLREQGIRYPEGPRRLEDQLFMVQSYFTAKVVSIVGDYPCYFYKRRPDAKNAGSAAIDPKVYYTNLREILDVVVAHTEPGEFRDLQLRRFYRVEMLGRLSEPGILGYDDDYRQQIFDEVAAIVRDYLNPAVTAGLFTMQRARAHAVERGDVCALVDLARGATPITAWASFDSFEYADGAWTISLHAVLRDASGEAVRLLRDGASGWRLVTGGEAPLDVPVTQGDLDAAFADVVIRERDTSVEWFVPHSVKAAVEERGDEARLVFAGTATLDPLTLASGHPLPRGSWDVAVRIHALGLVKRIRFGAERSPAVDVDTMRPVVTPEALVVLPYLTDPAGNFSLDVGEERKPLARELPRLGGVTASRRNKSVVLTLPLEGLGAGTSSSWSVVLGAAKQELERRPATVSVADGGITVSFDASRTRASAGWLGLVTRSGVAVSPIGDWRGRRRLRVDTDPLALELGRIDRRSDGGRRHRLKQVARRIRGRLTS